MGTNFYLKHIPTEEQVKKMHEAVDKLDFDEVKRLINESTRMIHIGKRSCGWQFIFDLHRNKEWEDNEDGIEIEPEEFCLEKIKKYVQTMVDNGWVLIDEYNSEFTPETFWKDEIGLWLYNNVEHMNYADYYEKYSERRYRATDGQSTDGLLYETVWFC